MLSLEDGEVVVKTARAAVEARFSGTHSLMPDVSDVLKEEKGVFVSLIDHSSGNGLRGCIGIPRPVRPLIDQVRLSAIEAANLDYRFKPLNLEELRNRIVIEATVLSPIEPIWVRNPLDLRENILVGRDGLVIEEGGIQGLLLPQVAVDEEFDSEEFLTHCCLKAGLPPDAWLTGHVKISRFQGQVFAEEKPCGRVFERRLQPKARRGSVD